MSAAISPDVGRTILESEIAPPVCPFCAVREASDERCCASDPDIVCRCCPQCRALNCRSASNE